VRPDVDYKIPPVNQRGPMMAVAGAAETQPVLRRDGEGANEC
jgi:hypothetical protein